MSIISFAISNKITKKEIASYDSSTSLMSETVNEDLKEIKTKSLELLNLASQLEINKRYKIQRGNYSLYYLLTKSNTFYQVIANQRHVDSNFDNEIYGLINEAENEKIRSQVDHSDNLTSVGMNNFNSLILKYQELLPEKNNLVRSETQESFRGRQQTDPIELEDIKEEIDMGNPKPVEAVNLSHTSLYGSKLESTQFYFCIARGIVWSASAIISLISIYLILDNYS